MNGAELPLCPFQNHIRGIQVYLILGNIFQIPFSFDSSFHISEIDDVLGRNVTGEPIFGDVKNVQLGKWMGCPGSVNWTMELVGP